ncbi:hypothetical protein CLOM_g2054 [Closterium sp. NIES-68]|nr:hypothetical protein CLOM_g20192 [Closterium sp. NIES-68]GJP39733.1 hypothetical protein CLOM_g24076 [Closterium sp. NIES-68]GJP42499.1 hypothetical protein CLOM_g2054 [Closterium sp. NIES-68]
MAQKVNPIAVRLRFNRSSDSSWFSDYYYSTLLYQDLNFRDYLSSIKEPNANKLGFRLGKCVIHHYPKRSLIHLFCLGRKSTIPEQKSSKARSAIATFGMFHDVNTVSLVGSLQAEARSDKSNIRNKICNSFAPNPTSAAVSIRKAHPVGHTSGSSESWSSSPINKKKKALAFYARKSYNSSKLSLNQLGNVFLRIAPTFLEKEGHANLAMNMSTFKLTRHSDMKSSTTLLQKKEEGFLANLLELDKVATMCTRSSAKDLGAKREKLTSYPLKKEKADLSECFTHLLGSGWTTLALSAANHRLVREDLPGRNAMMKLKQVRLESLRTLYFHYYAMQYFFLKRANAHGSDRFRKQVQALVSTNSFAPSSKCRYFYLTNVQSILSDKTNTLIDLRPIKVSSIFQSASLIAQEIACKLEQKKSFRQICRSIFQQISNCKYIKGIRINCSGRLNGAEIAKSSCRKNGETSLHVFSDKIDYAQTRASTPYGILGVKVWISYI